MINPRLRHLPNGGSTKGFNRTQKPIVGASGNKYADDEAIFAKTIRTELGSEWFVDWPAINPARVIEFSAESPMGAARMLHYGCGLLGKGRNVRLREYLVSAFSIAVAMRDNKQQIEQLADYVIDGRTKSRMATSTIEHKLLHYLFIYIFHQSGFCTRNRASQYAESLQVQFDERQNVADVEQQLIHYGQNKLRKAKQKFSLLVQARENWSQRVGQQQSVSFLEVLQSVVVGEGGDVDGDDIEVEESQDLPRNPPTAEEFEADNLLDENDISLADEENKINEDREDEQIPEVDEFFEEAFQIMAYLIVGINEGVICPTKRETLLGQLRQLGVKTIMFRGLMA